MAILRDEAFVRNVHGVIFVGGKYEGPGFAPGYNVLVDPEAADIVVRSGVPLLMIIEAARKDSVLVAEDYDHAAAFRTRRSEFFIKSNALRREYEMKYRGATGSVNADPMAVALAADPCNRAALHVRGDESGARGPVHARAAGVRRGYLRGASDPGWERRHLHRSRP
jgi:inosine-uridine nucleoside N-ribohydrolase